MITLQDLRQYLTTGIFNALNNPKHFTKKDLRNAIISAIEFYKLYVPCLDLANTNSWSILRPVVLPHIAIILSYQTLDLLPAQTTEAKGLVERKYDDLIAELKTDLGGIDGKICSRLVPVVNEPEFEITTVTNMQTIGRI
jgi:hypothetical protein